MIKLILTTFLVVLPFKLIACFVPTGELANEHQKLITETPKIVYAVVENVQPIKEVRYAENPGEYKFKTIVVLKGDVGGRFSVKGEMKGESTWDTTFNNHTEKNFWEGKTGRLGNIGDCRTTSPLSFVQGKKYLLFIGGPDDSKKAERVETEADKWFQFVKEYTK